MIKITIKNDVDISSLLSWIERGVVYKTIKTDGKDIDIHYEVIESKA